MSQERQLLEQWARQNPAYFEGLKQAIAGAEGTILGGGPGYNVMFGGGRFTGYSRHPNKVITSPGGYSSAAAGAYQFMPGTFSEVQRKLNLPDFGPRSQDLAMLAKARERLMPVGGLAAITKAGTLTPEIQAALSPEWASFPTQSGKSYYGQPVKSREEIQKFFEQGMKRGGSASTASAAPAPAPKSSSLFQNFLYQQLMSGVNYKSPVNELLQKELLSVLPKAPDYSNFDLKTDDLSTGLAHLGFPSIL